jgi:site-specific DNA recombinase
MQQVVGYARYSSDNQKECSIEIQKQWIEKYCQDNALKLVKVFADYAKSGSTEEGRDSFIEMRNVLIDDEDIDGVVVYKIDRLSRNNADAVRFVDTITKFGKSIYTDGAVLTDKSSPMEKLIFSFGSSIAEFEWGMIRQRTRKGSLHKASLGPGSLGGKPPLGYIRPDPNKPLVLDPKKAEIVKMIFDLYVNKHKGYGEIAKTLNSYGYLTQRNAEFGKNSIRDILLNEKYTGVEIYNKTSAKVFGKDGKYHRNSHISKPNSEIYRHPNAHPAIISKELFDKAQELMKSRSRKGGHKSNALFTGIIFCGFCKSPIHLDSHSMTCKNGIKYTYRKYRCNHYSDPGDHAKVRAEAVEHHFLNMMKYKLFHEMNKTDLHKQLQIFFSENSSGLKQLSLHKVKAHECEKKMNRLARSLEASENENVQQRIIANLDTLSNRLQKLNQRIAELEQANRWDYTENELTAIIDSFEPLVLKYAKCQETKDFIRSYIDKVTIYDVSMSVSFNYNEAG